MNRILRSFHFEFLALLLLAPGLRGQIQLQVNPPALAFSAVAGSPALTQNISVGSSGDVAGEHISYSAIVQTTSSSSASWLSLNNAAGVTPATITVFALAGAMPEGVYSAQILIGGSGSVGNSPQVIPVTFTVAHIAASPALLNFNYQIGGSLSQPQTVLVSGPAGGVSFSASASTASGGDWLEVAPTSGTTTSTVTVNLNPAVIGTLAAGTYDGLISLAASGDSTVVNVPVALTVSNTPQVTASPSVFSFGYQIGGTNNVTQQDLSVTSVGGAVTFTVAVTTAPNSAGGSWLVISSPGPNVTPATLTVGISPGTLPAGTYSGQVAIVASGTTLAALPVTLTISNNPLISVTPTVLNFAYQTSGAIPPAETIAISSTSTTLDYSVYPSTTSGGSWLQAISGNTTPNPISVTVNPAGLGAGVYNGQLMISANGAANSPQEIPVTLTVTAFPLVQTSPPALTFVYQTGQSTPPSQLVSITSSTGDQLDFSVTDSTASGGNWLSASLFTGLTPGTVNVAVAAAGLAPGTYSGTVTITATNPSGIPVPNSPLLLPVTFYVSADPLISISPGVLTFTAEAGAVTNGQEISLTSTSSVLNYAVSSATLSSGPWLLVAAPPGATPGSFEVYATAEALAAGTYSGSITIDASNPSGAAVADSPETIPVTFQVVAGTLSAAPLALTFSQTLGGALPESQNIKLSGTGSTPLSFTAVASNSSGVNWLTLTPTSGVTPATLSVSVDGSKLSAGTYIGLITVTAPNAAGSPITIQVTLTVTGAPVISLTPATLQFTSQVGSTAPAAQTIAVASSSGSLAFAAVATVSGSVNWLSVSPSSGSTPGTLSVSVNPAGLAAGSYTGSVTVTSTAAGNSPQVVNVTYTVTLPPAPLPTSVVNAASQAPGAVAPGEIISIYGTNLGPVTAAGPVISDNSVGTAVAGVQVMFDNNAAPLLYVSATQINAVVPFELASQAQTHMTITYDGAVSAAVDLVVAPTAPGIFTVTENGAGQGAIINSTGGVNGASNPAPAGSVIVLYAAGGGETSPPGVTGNITPNDGTGLKYVSGVTVTVAGLVCDVMYAGSAPGFIEGALQINVQLPANVPAGSQAVVVTINNVSSQAGVTVAVQ